MLNEQSAEFKIINYHWHLQTNAGMQWAALNQINSALFL